MKTDVIKNTALLSFEDFKQENGQCYWLASDLMHMLDYKDMSTFMKVIRKAQRTCLTLNIDTEKDFIRHNKDVHRQSTEYRLSRFACYLVVMNGDTKKTAVALAQVYFAEQTRKFEISLAHAEDIERVSIREELKEGHKTLSSTARHAGVTDFARFHNAGYKGMYNMFNTALAKKRNIKQTELLEYMGRAELAANLFRITQTEERIKYTKFKGQNKLEETHRNVGRKVRKMVQKNTGKAPEELPIESTIANVKKQIKKVSKRMIQQDEGTKKN